MTKEELNRVRELQKKMRDCERRLQTLRISVDNLVPILDGLPHGTTARSRVEKIALLIVESEQELSELGKRVEQERSELVAQLVCEVDDLILLNLLALRYVKCCTFKEIARRMRITLRHVFRLHEKFLKCHIDAPATS